jgi:hypothetical protein
MSVVIKKEDQGLTANVTVVHADRPESTVEAENHKDREGIMIVLRDLKERLGSEYENCDIAVMEVRKGGDRVTYCSKIHPRSTSTAERIQSSPLMDKHLTPDDLPPDFMAAVSALSKSAKASPDLEHLPDSGDLCTIRGYHVQDITGKHRLLTIPSGALEEAFGNAENLETAMSRVYPFWELVAAVPILVNLSADRCAALCCREEVEEIRKRYDELRDRYHITGDFERSSEWLKELEQAVN